MASQRDMNLSVAGIEVTIQTDEDRGYMLKLASMVDEKVTTYLKMGTRVTLAMAAVLAAACLVMGLFPRWLLDVIGKAVGL